MPWVGARVFGETSTSQAQNDDDVGAKKSNFSELSQMQIQAIGQVGRVLDTRGHLWLVGTSD
jgi:hypothetical protein